MYCTGSLEIVKQIRVENSSLVYSVLCKCALKLLVDVAEIHTFYFPNPVQLCNYKKTRQS